MKSKALAWITLAGLLTALTACVRTVDGRRRAAIPFTKDMIESRYERPVSQIFAASKEVLTYLGTLTGENTINNTLEARVDTRTVLVAVDEVEPKISRVRTQVRKKGGGADVDLAAEIDKQVALRLK